MLGKKKEEECNLFFTYLNPKESKNGIWFLDNGCSNHMTGEKTFFHNLDEPIKLQVWFGDDKALNIEGEGLIAVKTKSKLLNDVYYIHSLAHNLLSVGQLIHK